MTNDIMESMIITKCDICKVDIKDEKISLNVVRKNTAPFFASFEFCADCSVPLKNFLKRNNLLKQEKGNAKQKTKK